MIQRLIALLLVSLFLPFFVLFFILVKLTSKGPFLFTQVRLGKDQKPFQIYKIRTMVEDAEKKKSKYRHLNEASGPIFKIYNDPRYTSIGRFFSHCGIDELPQFINIVKGEMGFVGPRPLPPNEVVRIPRRYEKRFSVLPGITSLWVVKGSHSLSFEEWMQLDVWYAEHKSIAVDLNIAFKTAFLIAALSLRNVCHLLLRHVTD